MTIIHDNRKGNTILAYDVIKDKLHNFLSDDVGHRNHFNPFFKIHGCRNNEFMAISGSRVNLSYNFESPLRGRPW